MFINLLTPGILDLFRMKDFMKTVPDRKMVDVYLRHATPETYRSVLNEIKNLEIYNMLVDTKSKHVNHFLRGVRIKSLKHVYIPFTLPLLSSVCVFFFFQVDTAAPDERLQISLSFHIICKYLYKKCDREVLHVLKQTKLKIVSNLLIKASLNR
jgi:hypothetical protein